MNTEKIRICVLAEAGLGGTGKAATIYAAELATRGYDVDFIAAKGPRTAFLTSRGVRSLEPGNSETDLYNYICRERPHMIHRHAPGYPTDNRLYRVLRRIRFGERPKMIETNVFGRLEDPEGDDLVDFRMFVSMASATQCFRRARIKDPVPALDRHTVLYNPILPTRRIGPTARREFRERLGVTDGDVLAVRVGRPGHKWTSWECKAYAIAKRTLPQLRLFLMEPPPWLARKIEKGSFGSGIITHKETSEFDWLDELYAAADVMIHASDWGESFGYTIAEAMAAGLPVITRSTPWCDNAQVELVKNRETGFVCWSVPEMARRLVDLALTETTREQMRTAARRRILALADVQSEIEILEEVIRHLVFNEPLSKVNARNRDLLEFTRNFSALEKNFSESFGSYPIDALIGSLHAAYRFARSSARGAVDRLKRRQNLPRLNPPGNLRLQPTR